MKITEVGFYRDIEGNKIEITHIKEGFAFGIYRGEYCIPYIFNTDTGCDIGDGDAADLSEKWQDPKPPVVFEGWLNVFFDVHGDGELLFAQPRKTKELAKNSGPSAIDCLHIRYDSSKPLKERIEIIGE